MKLVVTRKHHTHAGETYRVGGVFDGTERLLQVFGDRLAPAAMPAPAAPVTAMPGVEPDGRAALRAEYAELTGTAADARWGVGRLTEEIANARATVSE